MKLVTGADAFIAGKPAVYSGLDGKLYVATFTSGERNHLGVPSLTVTKTNGEIVRDVLLNECSARSFYWNLDAEAA